jgi:hypothetical protein
MKYKVTSIYDNATQSYKPPMYNRSVGEVERSLHAFYETAPQSHNDLYAFPEHYSLFLLGEWDDTTGKHDYTENPEHIANLHEIKAKVEEKRKLPIGIVDPNEEALDN